MPITGREAGNPMLRKWYWACFSMAMRRVCGVSRKIERATYEAVPFPFIAGDQHPDHDTLATFRRPFRPELKRLFLQGLLLAQEGGVLNFVSPPFEGLQSHAGASRHKATSCKSDLELETQL